MPRKSNRICAICSTPFYGYAASVLQGKSKFCSRACYGISRRRGALQRFWANVTPKSVEECWNYSSASPQINHGYGVVVVDGKQTQAHRYSWELHNGPIPAGLWVLHKCDNRKCVNPNHLFLGDLQDNVDDMVKKGRRAPTKGEKNPKAKLTWSDVDEIRRLLKGGQESRSTIANRFGVSKCSIGRIDRNQAWQSY